LKRSGWGQEISLRREFGLPKKEGASLVKVVYGHQRRKLASQGMFRGTVTEDASMKDSDRAAKIEAKERDPETKPAGLPLHAYGERDDP